MLCYFIDIHVWLFPFYGSKHFFLFMTLICITIFITIYYCRKEIQERKKSESGTVGETQQWKCQISKALISFYCREKFHFRSSMWYNQLTILWHIKQNILIIPFFFKWRNIIVNLFTARWCLYLTVAKFTSNLLIVKKIYVIKYNIFIHLKFIFQSLSLIQFKNTNVLFRDRKRKTKFRLYRVTAPSARLRESECVCSQQGRDFCPWQYCVCVCV